jgi:hypothetical protein
MDTRRGGGHRGQNRPGKKHAGRPGPPAGREERGGTGAIEPARLIVVEREGRFVLLHRGTVVTTPGGRPLAHGARRLLELIRRETEIAREFDIKHLSAFALFATQADEIETGTDPVAHELAALLSEADPLLGAAGSGGGEGDDDGGGDSDGSGEGDGEVDGDDAEGAADEDGGDANAGAEDVAPAVTAAAGTGSVADDELPAPLLLAVRALEADGLDLGDAGDEEDLAPAFVDAVRGQWDALPTAARAGAVMLHRLHKAGVLLPLAFVRGRLTVSEYAEALLTMHGAHPRFEREAGWQGYRNNFVIAREDASIVQEFVTLSV